MLLAITGCASLADPNTDALAKLMKPIESKAIIYVFRNEEYSWPARIGMTLDGKDMGSTQANTYFRWSVEPGQHILVSESENKAPLVLTTEPGKVYYIWQDVSMGYFRARSTLREVDRSTAEIAMRSCYLLG
jgi:hypothetical protein